MKKVAIHLFVLFAIVGCAAKEDPATVAAANAPLICEGKNQCELYWQKSQAWLATNSAWKIQTANDTIINTYNPAPNAATLGYQLVKNPLGNDRYEIIVQTSCGNVFGCIPSAVQQTASLKTYVKS
ncbi:TPA: hypothetical protein ACIAJC_001628 [Citrobacter freundii]